MLGRIQNDLFDLGADLCAPRGWPQGSKGACASPPAQVERLEREIDAMNADAVAADRFVLPGGTALAAHLHLARAIARRAEARSWRWRRKRRSTRRRSSMPTGCRIICS